MFVQVMVKTLKRKCWKQSQTIKYMFECLMYIFEDRICTFGYLKIPDIILFIVSSQKLEWTHTLAPTSFMRDYFIFDRDTLYGANLYGPVLTITTNITRFYRYGLCLIRNFSCAFSHRYPRPSVSVSAF